MIDTNAIRARVKDALSKAGQSPWLVAYDINGIQQLVTASNRPITMRGASRMIQCFDEDQQAGDLAIFAGGGRGYELAKSRSDAEERIVQLQRDLRNRTTSGVLAAATVPYDRTRSQESLKWLRYTLDNAKDAACRPGGDLPSSKDEQCEDCHALRQCSTINVRDGVRHVCARCNLFIEYARKNSLNDDISQSLLNYAKGRRIVAVSADGNNMGQLFGLLASLEQMAVISKAVGRIFQAAHEQAARGRNVLAPITGGDDIRAFMAPDDLLDYVESLARGIEDRVRTAGNLGGILDRPDIVKAFGRIGIGIGAVVADDHYPASQLIAHAHALEVRAKRICRSDKGARSAFDFAILSSEDPSLLDKRRSSPLSMEPLQWQRAMEGAKHLRSVPSTQRALLAERGGFDSREEFENFFLYQVARSGEWQTWFKKCNIDWTKRDSVWKHLDKTRADLVDLLPAPKDIHS